MEISSFAAGHFDEAIIFLDFIEADLALAVFRELLVVLLMMTAECLE
jgi:hypothetical protein